MNQHFASALSNESSSNIPSSNPSSSNVMRRNMDHHHQYMQQHTSNQRVTSQQQHHHQSHQPQQRAPLTTGHTGSSSSGGGAHQHHGLLSQVPSSSFNGMGPTNTSTAPRSISPHNFQQRQSGTQHSSIPNVRHMTNPGAAAHSMIPNQQQATSAPLMAGQQAVHTQQQPHVPASSGAQGVGVPNVPVQQSSDQSNPPSGGEINPPVTQSSISSGSARWYFNKYQLHNTRSVKEQLPREKELSYRQQAANFIQDMGQRLQVTQLCINTAIVYMQRFYMFHSFYRFHRNAIASASLFLAAKVEEQPRKLEHVIKVAHICLHRDQPQLDTRSEAYTEQAQELVTNENILLQTLGFDVAIDHPHTHVVRCCQLVKASKELAQTSYFMATNSLHLTTMCLRYAPTIVACVCIHLACKWSNYKIPLSAQGKPWFTYVDSNATLPLLQHLTDEFLSIFEKCPSRLKKKIMASTQATKEEEERRLKSAIQASHYQPDLSVGGSSSSPPSAGSANTHPVYSASSKTSVTSNTATNISQTAQAANSNPTSGTVDSKIKSHLSSGSAPHLSSVKHAPELHKGPQSKVGPTLPQQGTAATGTYMGMASSNTSSVAPKNQQQPSSKAQHPLGAFQQHSAQSQNQPRSGHHGSTAQAPLTKSQQHHQTFVNRQQQQMAQTATSIQPSFSSHKVASGVIKPEASVAASLGGGKKSIFDIDEEPLGSFAPIRKKKEERLDEDDIGVKAAQIPIDMSSEDPQKAFFSDMMTGRKSAESKYVAGCDNTINSNVKGGVVKKSMVDSKPNVNMSVRQGGLQPSTPANTSLPPSSKVHSLFASDDDESSPPVMPQQTKAPPPSLNTPSNKRSRQDTSSTSHLPMTNVTHETEPKRLKPSTSGSGGSNNSGNVVVSGSEKHSSMQIMVSIPLKESSNNVNTNNDDSRKSKVQIPTKGSVTGGLDKNTSSMISRPPPVVNNLPPPHSMTTSQNKDVFVSPHVPGVVVADSGSDQSDEDDDGSEDQDEKTTHNNNKKHKKKNKKKEKKSKKSKKNKSSDNKDRGGIGEDGSKKHHSGSSKHKKNKKHKKKKDLSHSDSENDDGGQQQKTVSIVSNFATSSPAVAPSSGFKLKIKPIKSPPPSTSSLKISIPHNTMETGSDNTPVQLMSRVMGSNLQSESTYYDQHLANKKR